MGTSVPFFYFNDVCLLPFYHRLFNPYLSLNSCGLWRFAAQTDRLAWRSRTHARCFGNITAFIAQYPRRDITRRPARFGDAALLYLSTIL
jgi:hypothetical protein